MSAAETALKVTVNSMSARRRALTAQRDSLAEDVMRHGRDNPAQKRQWQREIARIDIRLDELDQLGNVLRVLGIDVRPEIEMRRSA